jgi:hypothetical protein
VNGLKALLVLFGVAGTVLAVLVLGGLSRADRVAVPAITTLPSADTSAIALAVVDPGQWARFRRQADGICEDAKQDVQRQIDRIRLASVPEQVLTSLDRTLRIQGKTITRLSRLKRPTGLGARIAKFLAVFRAQLADDRRLVRRIEVDTLSVADAEHALRRESRRVARVTRLSDELGITACSRYVDYDFYE